MSEETQVPEGTEEGATAEETTDTDSAEEMVEIRIEAKHQMRA